MPKTNVCNKIADPAARKRCLKYEGEFARPIAGGVDQPEGLRDKLFRKRKKGGGIGPQY